MFSGLWAVFYCSVFFAYRYLEDSLINKDNRVGSKYSKVVYERYTDGSYTKEIPTPDTFGYVGPLLRGESGETMRIHFRNSADFPITVHPHGVLYDKSHEGYCFFLFQLFYLINDELCFLTQQQYMSRIICD